MSAESHHRSTEWMADFLAGWISGAASILACQPVDTILTRWQAATAASHWRVLTLELVQTAGPAALWRGASPVLLAAPLQNALLMGGYGMGTRWFEPTNGNDDENDNRSRQLAAIFVGGCTGGVVQSFVTSPVELVKVAQQTGGARVLAAAHSLVTHRMAMRGLTATLWRDGLPHGVWFLAYDVSKATLMMQQQYGDDDREHRSIPVPVSLASGAVAATIAWAVGYPADLIKTRIQAATTTEPRGILATARTIVQEADGRIIAGLYRGFGMKLVRSIPASMIGFTVYEGVKERIVTLLNTVVH